MKIYRGLISKNNDIIEEYSELILEEKLSISGLNIVWFYFCKGVIILKKEQSTSLKHLEEQLQWCKEQDDILEKIETALYDMKEIAEYAAENQLNLYERNKLNDEMNQLKDEVASLEKQLDPSQVIHWIKPL